MQKIEGYIVNTIENENYFYGSKDKNSFSFFKMNDTILFAPYGKTLTEEEEKNILKELGFSECQVLHFNFAEWKEKDIERLNLKS
jgi:hypothetical protein